MDNFTRKMKRKFNAVYKPKQRRSRPAKLIQLHRDAGDQLSSIVPVTPNSEVSTEVPQSEQGEGEQRADQDRSNDIEEETPAILDELEPTEKRDIIYLVFNGEDETDYTEGPARMVFATDGVRDTCGSLLLTLSLSKNVQEAIWAERAFAKAQRTAESKRQIYTNFRSVLNAEIANHNLRLLREDGEESESQKRRLQEELANLELMVEENQLRQQKVQTDLESQARVLREIQRQANVEIEEAFVCARLLEPEDDVADDPVDELDLQQEYQNFVAPSEVVDGDSEVTVAAVVLDTSRNHRFASQGPVTKEQRRERELNEAVWTAHDRFQKAQAAFDRRESARLDEYSANAQAAARGEETMDASPEDFDLRWVQKIQELTREIIEAESALSAAKAAAVDGGIDVPMDDRASGFVDDVADGYRMSMEQAMIGSVPSPKIKDWISGIPEVASPSFNEHSNEADDWEAEDVEISDSVSMVAQDAGERRRIDKWRQVCGL
jgi:hypothetical protein